MNLEDRDPSSLFSISVVELLDWLASILQKATDILPAYQLQQQAA